MKKFRIRYDAYRECLFVDQDFKFFGFIPGNWWPKKAFDGDELEKARKYKKELEERLININNVNKSYIVE